MMSQQRYRYPGLKPFEVADAALFFGREREVLEFYNLVMVERLVVLFAKSGMGKTSLINAGLIPLLGKSDLLPVYVRFNNTALSLHEQFFQKMESAGVVFDERYRHKSLWEQLKYASATKNGRPATPLLIFDQFEEIFTLYNPERRLPFVRDFAYVANGKIPESVQAELLRLVQDDPNVSDDTLAELERQPVVRSVFSIRSDLLHLLNALSPQIPDILRSRYELTALDAAAAREAITRPAGADLPDFLSPPFRYDEAALAEILSELSRQGQENIESFQLQIICQAIEKRIVEQSAHQITKSPDKQVVVTPALYGNAPGIQRLLTDFYTDKIGELPEDQRFTARCIVEEQLITENERRRSVDEDDLLKRGASRDLLDRLVEMRLLRKEPRLDTYYYEISHDTLVPPILVKYRERRQEEEQQAEIERLQREQDERDAQLAEERRKRDRARRVAAGLGALSVVSLLALGGAWWQYQEAEKSRLAAEQKQQEAVAATQTAIAEKNRADSLANAAQRNAEEAENQRNAAVAALEKAEAERRQRIAVEVKKYMDGARRMRELGDLQLAEAMLREALALDPGNVEVLRALRGLGKK